MPRGVRVARGKVIPAGLASWMSRRLLAHGYDTAFWWTAGIFVGGAVIGGAVLRRGPLVQKRTPPRPRRRANGTSQGTPVFRHVARITVIR